MQIPDLSHDRLRERMREVVADFHLQEPAPSQDEGTPGHLKKRAFRDPSVGSPMASVALVQEEDGLVRWSYTPAPRRASHRRRRGVGPADAHVVHRFEFREVPPNKIGERLEALDDSLTPYRGLRQWRREPADAAAHVFTPVPFEKPAAPLKRVLLFVHGTFSKGEMYFEELGATAQGEALLSDLNARYDALLTFDHGTLSLSAWMNAFDLTEQTRGIAEHIDVVCHSRGGLVVAWWLRQSQPPVGKVIFVGSPLAGTSLASPPQLKKALDLLGNYAKALGMLADTSATVVPMLAIAGGLMKIFGAVLWAGAKTPLLDAGVAIIPGLSSQSYVGNNQELLRLFGEGWPARYQLYAIHSSYEPAEGSTDPWWRFWMRFRRMRDRVIDWGADTIFEDKNDLVVDMFSMRQLGLKPDQLIPEDHCLDLSGERRVHHCVYFREPQTIQHLRDWLEVNSARLAAPVRSVRAAARRGDDVLALD